MSYLANHPFDTRPTTEEVDQIDDATKLVGIRQAASVAEDALLKLEEKLHLMDYRRQSVEAHEMYAAVSKIGDAVNRDFALEPEDIQNMAEKAAA